MNLQTHTELCDGKLILLGRNTLRNFKGETPLADIRLEYGLMRNTKVNVDALVLFWPDSDVQQQLSAAGYTGSISCHGKVLIVKPSKEFPINVRCTESYSAFAPDVERTVKSIWPEAEFFISGAQAANEVYA